MSEQIRIQVNPDGTLDILAGDYLEAESQVEIDDLIKQLGERGFSPRKQRDNVEFTGEFHKHTHTHDLHEHH